jgi:ribosomal 50S subunit-associated protein YjgA (DUF615 family)
LENILIQQFGYDKNVDVWIESFINKFEQNGPEAINEFENKFGVKNAEKLRKLIKINNDENVKLNADNNFCCC